MSLDIVKRAGRSTLYIRGTVRGTAVYESTGTRDRTLAEAYRAKRETEIWTGSVFGERAVATFARAAASYLTAESRKPDTARRVAKLLEHFGHATKLSDIDQGAIDKAYRVILTAGAGNATKLRSVLTPIRAIITHAAERGWCAERSFKTPKVPRTRTSFLRPDQATRLVAAAPDHLRPLIVFLIGTGSRMSEALELEWRQVDLIGARVVLSQKQGTDRHADLPAIVLRALADLPHRDGHVFRPPAAAQRRKERIARLTGAAVTEGYRDTGREGGGQIKTAWATACAKAGLPGEWKEWSYRTRRTPQRRFQPEFTPHDCRHTWASWHYCVHRDMMRLRDAGGWDTVSMVERYAKLMPDAYRTQIIAWWNGRAESVPLAGGGE